MTVPHLLSALAAAAIRAGDLTSERLVESCLAHIEARDAQVGASIHLDPEAALVEARQRDREETGSALHGVPAGIKDIIDTHDIPHASGKHERGHPPCRGDRLGIDRELYLWALGVREAARAAFENVFDSVDALITPAAPGEAPERIGWTGWPEFNRIWTTMGVPCITLPGFSPGNGRPGGDAGLLAAAAWLHPRLAG